MKTKITILFLLIFITRIFPQSTTISKTINVGTTMRNYLLHVPQSYVAGTATPLIIAYHGMYQDAAKMEQHSTLSIKSESVGFIIAYPNGLGNPTEWNENDKATSKANDLEFTRNLLDTLMANYSIDTTKIYVAGFSDGAGMAFRAACEIDKFAAVAAVAGALNPTDYATKRAFPAICFYSKNDNASTVSIMNNALTSWSKLNKSVTARDTFFTTSGALGFKVKGDNNTEFQMYVTDIGGHSWPGGLVSWATPSKAISANDLLWDFFLKHTNSASTDINISEIDNMPAGYRLNQNYPNPFNPATAIEFEIPVNGRFVLKIYDMLGQEVTTLLDKELQTGNYKVNFNAKKLASGMYIYRLSGNNINITKKMLFMK